MPELLPHDPAWAGEFRRESSRIRAALGDLIDAAEHVGSTAVPGLVAKPIIDIAVRTSASIDPFDLGAHLASLGYERHAGGPKNHGVYVRRSGGERTHILHAFNAEQWEYCNQRLFRDKLLRDEAARDRYQELKESIAHVDGRRYTAAKTWLIEELLNEERAARGLPAIVAWEKGPDIEQVPPERRAVRLVEF